MSVFHHDWKGLGYSRNVVVNNAKGEYIIWVDGDMSLPFDFVRRQVDYMDRNPLVGIAKGRYGLEKSNDVVSFLQNIDALVELLDFERNPLSKPLGTRGVNLRVDAIRSAGGFNDEGKGVQRSMEQQV